MTNKVLLGLCCLIFSKAIFAGNIEVTPNASLMPYPQKIAQTSDVFTLKSQLTVSVNGADQLTQQRWQQRLEAILNSHASTPITLTLSNTPNAEIQLSIEQPLATDTPQFSDSEAYELHINSQHIQLDAINELGINHGLTTLQQWLFSQKSPSAISGIKIQDTPRYPWRGLLIDSVRHFIPLSDILRQIDGMASAKLNVLHWHLTDDQGWRIESKSHPKLQQLASDGHFYTYEQIQQVVTYASDRGIRVVPELDVPGHASAIAVAYPELMSQPGPYSMERHWGVFEPLLDPTNPAVYQFIDALVAELAYLFPDTYLHIGGDEVPPAHWDKNPDIQKFMLQNGLKDAYALHNYFNQRVAKILAKYQRQMMGWDEIFHPDLPSQIVVQSWRGQDSLNLIASAGYQGLLSTGFYIDQPQYSSYHYRNDPYLSPSSAPKLSSDTAANVWQTRIKRLKGSAVDVKVLLFSDDSNNQAFINLNNKFSRLADITEYNSNKLHLSLDTWMGPLQIILEQDKSEQWQGYSLIGNSYYHLEAISSLPFEAKLLAEQHLKLAPAPATNANDLILGGEATIWSEIITANNLDNRIWPRLYVIAERLWSVKSLNNEQSMYQRLAIMDDYAQHIGLEHRQQQKNGWQQLIGKDNIEPLMTMAEALEPAHYYTRHHIKYQQQQYHQQAPLDGFVDFLDVESLLLQDLNQHLLQAQLSGADLDAFQQVFQRWQRNHAAIETLINRHSKLSALRKINAQLSVVNDIALDTIRACKSQRLTKAQASEFKNQLWPIISQQQEIIIAAAHTALGLIEHCSSNTDKAK